MSRHFRYPFVAVCAGLIMLLGVPAAASAADTPTPSADRSQTQQSVIRGRFTQRKYLAELQQPLVSTGQFVVAAGHGLLWQIETPVQVQLVITRKHLIQRSKGQQTTRINADQQPALRVVTAVLLAIFETDTERLRQYFNIEKKPGADGNGWTLTLQPATAGVSEFIQRVRIQGQGSAHVRRIEIDQTGGDRSVIELHETSDGPATLSSEEKAQFSD